MSPFHAPSVRSALLAHPSVDDVTVVPRVAGAITEQVAYVVRTSPVGPEDLLAHLSARGTALPDSFEFMARMPYLADGTIDVGALTAVGIPDASLVRDMERRFGSAPGVNAVAAVVHDAPPPLLPWHVDDVLPGTLETKGPTLQSSSRPSGATPDPSRRSTVPAIADGGPLPPPAPDEPIVLGDALRRAARRPGPDAGLTYVLADGTEEHETYAELLDRAERWLAGLQARGLSPGARVLLLLPGHRDFLGTFWACILGGFVPVPVAVPQRFDRSGTLSALQGTWRVTRPSAIVTTSPRHDVGMAAPPDDACLILSPSELVHAGPGRPHAAQATDLALLMMTSGSTGNPKAVMLSHQNLLARTRGSRDVDASADWNASLNWMPLDHVAGLTYSHLRDVYLRIRQVHITTSLVVQNPLAWLDALERYRATVTFAPNFAYSLVLERDHDLAARQWDLSTVRAFLNAGETIVARTARRFLSALAPHGLRPSAMRPAWGMSETASAVTDNERFSVATTSDDQPFVEVGGPLPACALRIVGEDDRPLLEGESGLLQVRGAVVTTGYFDAPALTREAFTADGWFKTGDLGVIRDGVLTVTGRAKDVVIINSVNYHCHAIESVVESIDGVVPSHTAACAIRRPGADTDGLAIFFVPRYDDVTTLAEVLRRVRADVMASIGINPDVVIPVPSDAIPKTSLGKIQRAALARRFLAGELDEHQRHADRVLGGARTIPQWFFRPAWQVKNGTGEAVPLRGEHVLVFGDGQLATEVRRLLDDQSARVIEVAAGNEWVRCVSDRFTIDPSDPSHYTRLLAELTADGIRPLHFIHLWEHGPYEELPSGEHLERAQARGSLSLIAALRALDLAHPQGEAVRLTSVASHVHRIRPSDRVAPEKATTVGLIKSRAQESAWISVRHVDIEDADAASVAALVLREHAELATDREVAYRDGQRLVPRLAAVTSDAISNGHRTIEHGGRYLITGGAGGVGAVLAEWLLERFQATLLVVGRRPAGSGPANVIERLRARGGDIAYAPVDVADSERLSALVAEHEARWGKPLDGVFHLAGSYQRGPVADLAPHAYLDILRPKMVGTTVLHRLLAARGGGLFVGWSSVAGVFGGADAGAYAAACEFQRAFAEWARDTSVVEHRCFDWSTWQDTGQSTGFPLEVTRSRGHLAMAPDKALDSLLVGLATGEASLAIGLDPRNRHVRRVLLEGSLAGHFGVFYTATGAAPDVTSIVASVRDRFGCPVETVVVRLPRLPISDSGGVDLGQLSRWGRSDAGATTGVAPRTDGERRLEPLWRRVLSVPAVTVTDNFFDCGGDSLSAVRMAGLVRDELGVELSVHAVFEAATFADLAQAVAAAAPRAVVAPSVARHTDVVDPAALLARMDDLSDEQVESLLVELGERPAADT